MCFLFYFSITADTQRSVPLCISFRGTAQWADSHILYRVVPPLFQLPHLAPSTVIITILSQHYCLYPLRRALHPHDCFFITNLGFSAPWPFHPASPQPLRSGSHPSVLCARESVSVLFAHVFCFLDPTYTWNRMAFVFLCLTRKNIQREKFRRWLDRTPGEKGAPGSPVYRRLRGPGRAEEPDQESTTPGEQKRPYSLFCSLSRQQNRSLAACLLSVWERTERRL